VVHGGATSGFKRATAAKNGAPTKSLARCVPTPPRNTSGPTTLRGPRGATLRAGRGDCFHETRLRAEN